MARIRLTGGSYSKRHSSRSSPFPRVRRNVKSSRKVSHKLIQPIKRVLINVAGEITITPEQAILDEKNPQSGLLTGKQYLINLESLKLKTPQEYKDTKNLEVICTLKGRLEVDFDNFPKDYIYQVSCIHYVVEVDQFLPKEANTDENHTNGLANEDYINHLSFNLKNTEKFDDIREQNTSDQVVFEYVGSKDEIERQITDYLQTIIGGVREVITPDRDRIDLLTEDHLIEVKAARDWDNSLGQILKYKLHYPNHKLIIFLFDDGFSCEEAKSKLLTIIHNFINVDIHVAYSITDLKFIIN
jgi:hypothetical protein